jgi:hypothetical protein
MLRARSIHRAAAATRSSRVNDAEPYLRRPRPRLPPGVGNQALMRMLRASMQSPLVTAEGGTPTPQPAPPATPTPQPTPPAAPAPQPAAPAPTLDSGRLEITSTPATVISLGSSIPAFSGFKIEKSFTVKGYGKVNLPPNDSMYDVGVVQNVFFDHMEQKFDNGDMLIDVVGPYVDVADVADVPFIHGNKVAASTLNYSMSTSYTDVPSQKVTPLIHCKTSWAHPVSADRTVTFRAGLVARHQITGKLTYLGASDKTYRVKWHADFDGLKWKITDEALAGTYPLSASATALTLGGTLANDAGQTAVQTEIDAFKDRCENVLPDEETKEADDE